MVDVILPAWVPDEETLELTVRSVHSIRSAECNLIIIDNGSTLGGGKLRELADVYVRNKTNLGYAKAVNQGLKLAGPVAAISNNDIVVSPNWWEVSEEILVDPNVGTIHFRMIGYFDDFNHGEDYWKEGRERWCSGSFFVTRNKWLFDENFLNSYDDWSYQMCIRDEGYSTTYTNKAQYKHLDSHTQKKIPEREERNQRNREYFRSKHGEYAEDIFARQFPEQLLMPYKPMP